MQIRLLRDCKCAGDIHEETHYPRPGFKAKPTLPEGTILDVDKTWQNFYGQFYRCGQYDIPIENAQIISVF